MAEHPTIHQALAAVMADVQAVGKTGRNESQNFSFRGIDAVVNAVGPAFREHGVVSVPTEAHATYEVQEVGRNGAKVTRCHMALSWRFYGPAGDYIESSIVSEAMDSGDKATAKAASVAYRTCLLQLLCIPTDEPDPDATSYELAPAAKPEPTISKADADRLVAVMKAAADPAEAKAAWHAHFGVWPSALPASRLAEADDFLSDLTPEVTP
jgi:hypothetical protein